MKVPYCKSQYDGGGSQFAGTVEGSSRPEPWTCPKHLWPIVCAIAKRQKTTPDMVLRQAVSDYCHKGQ